MLTTKKSLKKVFEKVGGKKFLFPKMRDSRLRESNDREEKKKGKRREVNIQRGTCKTF
jgi:hypothetical protein